MSDDRAVTGLGGQTRRVLLSGAGAVGASVVLAACGTGDDDANDGASNAPANPPAGNSPAATAGATAPAAAAAIAKKSDIPVGGGKIIPDEEIVITQPKAGEFKAFSAICTHQQCPLTGVDGGTINCTCHGSKFAIEDGSVKNGPATKKLAEKKVTVDGDNIVLA